MYYGYYGMSCCVAGAEFNVNVNNVYVCSKTLQKSRHVAMGRKKFNMDPKKVRK